MEDTSTSTTNVPSKKYGAAIRAGYVLRRPARRATASGGGTNPGDESAKTSLLVSNSLCIAPTGAGDGAATAAAAAVAAAAVFFRRRRFFLDEARPSSAMAVGARSTLPLGSDVLPPPACTGMTKQIAGRWEKRAQDSGGAGARFERGETGMDGEACAGGVVVAI